jgi:hypothetical protein
MAGLGGTIALAAMFAVIGVLIAKRRKSNAFPTRYPGE